MNKKFFYSVAIVFFFSLLCAEDTDTIKQNDSIPSDRFESLSPRRPSIVFERSDTELVFNVRTMGPIDAKKVATVCEYTKITIFLMQGSLYCSIKLSSHSYNIFCQFGDSSIRKAERIPDTIDLQQCAVTVKGDALCVAIPYVLRRS